MTFAQRRNRQTTPFLERIPLVKRRMTVFLNRTFHLSIYATSSSIVSFGTPCEIIMRSIKVNLSVFILRTENRSTLTTVTSAIENTLGTKMHYTIKHFIIQLMHNI